MPYFIHSTNAANQILESGQFLGTNKTVGTLGLPREALVERLGADQFKTMFGTPAQTRQSVSRIGERSGQNIRGVLIFSNEKGAIQTTENYPFVAGATVPLAELDLRLVLLERDDCRRTSNSWLCWCASTKNTEAYKQLLRKNTQPHVEIILVNGLRKLTVLHMQGFIDQLSPATSAPQQQVMV
jgi:hypothetical protein